ncbi:chemotaxis protein CheW [Georgenia sp. SYP-B2076]|uniref:chemotaxis protein CheW n=1 Tax=Georgenia sp. SYP-B2076 TaxID=2495881 RepID=UPI000F8F53B1|nr:chemotaxis protein CheW [Georgenia sp. SYP-B2076]
MTQLVTFTVGGNRYGVDVASVREAVRAPRRTPVPLAPPEVDGLANLRGQIVMRIDPRRRLQLPPRPAELRPMLIVAEANGETVGLLVDEVGDVVDVDPDQVKAAPRTLHPSLRTYITGAVPLPQGLLLVLDLAALTAPAPTSPQHEGAPA